MKFKTINYTFNEFKKISKGWLRCNTNPRLICLMTHYFVENNLLANGKPEYLDLETDNQLNYIVDECEKIWETKSVPEPQFFHTIKKLEQTKFYSAIIIPNHIPSVLSLASCTRYYLNYFYGYPEDEILDQLIDCFCDAIDNIFFKHHDDSITNSHARCISMPNPFYVANEHNWLKISKIIALFTQPEEWSVRWATANTISLAETIYNNKLWSRNPILADALMDEGCENEYLLWSLQDWNRIPKEKWDEEDWRLFATKKRFSSVNWSDVWQDNWSLFGRGVWVFDKLLGRRS